jgi:pseudaminic acid cytidylyltransferase|tara:strand:+ start:2232 stop:2936 length:705 start_codon:yes stop_codon:yes gene_type:complete
LIKRNKKIIAVIPARGGSKRIKKKNIKDFCGKPMITWPLEVLQKSNMIDEIIISTDSQEIASICESRGVKIPFFRPSNLADDFTGTAEVVKHATEWYLENIGNTDLVLTVYPTAIFLSNEDIKNAYDVMLKNSSEIVFTGTEYPYPIQRAVYLNDDNKVSMFEPENILTRSQDLKKSYHDAGQFYLSKKSAVINQISALSSFSSMLILPRERVVDIDTEEDFLIAERLFKLSIL